MMAMALRMFTTLTLTTDILLANVMAFLRMKNNVVEKTTRSAIILPVSLTII